MADNTLLNPGSGGDTIRTIDRTTFKTQVVQLDFGGEPGTESLATAWNNLPVDDSATQDTLQLILLELRVISTLISQMAQPRTDDVDSLRSDVNINQ
jgi:hypothetical protein